MNPIPIVGADRSPNGMIPLVLPDLLRAVDRVCRTHGVPPTTAIVCLLVAAASGSRQIGLEPMTYVATTLEAWAYAVKAEGGDAARVIEPPAGVPQ